MHIFACAKLAGQSGHVHLRGCRCSIIKAARIENKNVCFFPSSSFIFRSKDSFKAANEAIGQWLPTPFADLKLFHSTFFFPAGLMHLFASNIGPQIANMITTGTFTVSKQSEHPLRLRNKDIQKINSLLRESCMEVKIHRR
jgi:hypothetical protein